ncbi:MAG TPA: phosphoribosylformylglycinamidine synthase subunit PurS [Saprospiraceae bacterium]|nr:phosphoribosylformylglycinamidine synthase subunit PurS [Saprospiraceae bacterium]HQW55464.1 phosphoribosylformylglycinamidine synthase subunit PurS [Saprospiraceae bacterium]
MMKFIAEIDVMPLRELLDPQGKTVAGNMPHMGIMGVSNVRVGKHIQMELEAEDEDAARALVEEACNKLLANKIMESFSFTVHNA